MCSALQIIDLDLLDKVGSAKGVEELRVQLKQQVGCCCLLRCCMSSLLYLCEQKQKEDWMLTQNCLVAE
jgi:hypothetical protein